MMSDLMCSKHPQCEWRDLREDTLGRQDYGHVAHAMNYHVPGLTVPVGLELPSCMSENWFATCDSIANNVNAAFNEASLCVHGVKAGAQYNNQCSCRVFARPCSQTKSLRAFSLQMWCWRV